jgi:hypothetical protein
MGEKGEERKFLKNLTQAVTHLIQICEVPTSNLSQDSGYPDWSFCIVIFIIISKEM